MTRNKVARTPARVTSFTFDQLWAVPFGTVATVALDAIEYGAYQWGGLRAEPTYQDAGHDNVRWFTYYPDAVGYTFPLLLVANKSTQTVRCYELGLTERSES